jgi:hypothetical protein
VTGNDNQKPGKTQRQVVFENVAAGLRAPGFVALCGWVAILSWCTPLIEQGGRNSALFGWLGVFLLVPAWYANIPFLINVLQCFNGRYPGIWSASIGAALAATVLMPHIAIDEVNDVYIRGTLSVGPLTWFWLGAFAFVWLLALVKAIWLTDK